MHRDLNAGRFRLPGNLVHITKCGYNEYLKYDEVVFCWSNGNFLKGIVIINILEHPNVSLRNCSIGRYYTPTTNSIYLYKHKDFNYLREGIVMSTYIVCKAVSKFTV